MPERLGKTLMVQGTASSVGKSLMVTGLCRLLARRGLKVAPFKAQNMALNAAVTPDGLEIGRAQAVQAEAAGVVAQAEMNPILLKPEEDGRSQVVVLGKTVGAMDACQYHAYKPSLRSTVTASLAALRAEYQVVVIEGAGSPVEINLRDHDLVNMFVATHARAPVLLVGDIDPGGVFAALVGTLELLRPAERALVAGLLINKFRGDVALLQPGLDFLEARTGKLVWGVVPYISDLRIAEEDALSLPRQPAAAPDDGGLDIVVLRLPRIANHDDFQPLQHAPGVTVRFIEHADAIAAADLVIVPGSKSTATDLRWLQARGFAQALQARALQGAPVLGIGGGAHMLGHWVRDPLGVESSLAAVQGLGLLPFSTRLLKGKVAAQTQARLHNDGLLGAAGDALSGYEIHHAELQPAAGWVPACAIVTRNGQACTAWDGATAGAVLGTAMHGLFNSPPVRSALLRALWKRKKRVAPTEGQPHSPQKDYDRVADALEEALDLPTLMQTLGL